MASVHAKPRCWGVRAVSNSKDIYIMKNVETNLFNGRKKEKQPGKHSNKTVAVVVGFDILVSLSLNGKDTFSQRIQKQCQTIDALKMKIIVKTKQCV